MQPTEILHAMYDARPLIFGHRGARADAPENTLPAFELAAHQGAHGIELDVHLSQDGHIVVMHDFTVDTTTDGSGPVMGLTLDALRALDAGRWFGPDFAGTRIPTLDEVFEAVGQRLFINIEIKSLTPETNGIETAVAACVTRHAMQQRVIISSFNPVALLRVRAALPDVPLGFLYDADTLPLVSALLPGLSYEATHPRQDLIDAALVAQARQAGHLVNAWTVNDPARGQVLRDLGVDGLITDAPGALLAAL